MKNRKYTALIILCMLSVFILAGCKVSEDEVKESEYYQQLKKSYDELKKEKEELTEKLEAAEKPSVDDERAKAYFEKIVRDTMSRVEIGYADDMEESVFAEDKAALIFVNELANRADPTAHYTVEELDKKKDKKYQYVFYDEDNSVYEMTVYEGDYVVFPDLPKKVFYIENASALGEAFLGYRIKYPESNLFHRMADTPFVSNQIGKYYENEVAVSIASYIHKIDKKKSSEDAAKKYWKEKKKNPSLHEYSFYHHGNVMKLGLYDSYLYIKNVDGKNVWYQVTSDNIKTIRGYFKAYTKKHTEKKESQEKQEESAEDSMGHNTDIDENVGN